MMPTTHVSKDRICRTPSPIVEIRLLLETAGKCNQRSDRQSEFGDGEDLPWEPSLGLQHSLAYMPDALQFIGDWAPSDFRDLAGGFS